MKQLLNAIYIGFAVPVSIFMMYGDNRACSDLNTPILLGPHPVTFPAQALLS